MLIALLAVATLATSTTTADWHEAALDYRDAAIEWRRVAGTRRVELDEQAGRLTDLERRNSALEHALAQRPIPESVTPEWVPWAIAGAAVVSAAAATFATVFVMQRGPP